MIKLILTNFFLFCLLLVGSIFYYLTMTTPGLQTDIQVITRMFAGKLRIGSVEGKLASDFSLKNISWQDNSGSIRIQSISLGWDPRGLLLHKFVINSLNVDHATIVIPTLPASSNTTKNNKPFPDFFKNIIVRQARFNQISLKLADAEISLQGTLQKNWDLQWKANIPETSLFLKNSKGSISTSGSITGPLLTPDIKARFRGKNVAYADQKINDLNVAINIVMQPKINSSITLSATGVKLDDYPLKKFDLSMTGAITRNKKIVSTHITSLINNRYTVSADFTFPEFAGITESNQPVTGKVFSSFSRLDLLKDYIPQIKDPRGNLQAIVLVKGVLAHPDITANFNLSNGQVRIPVLGITPRAIHLQASVTLAKKLDFSGTFMSGKGRAELRGSIDFNNPDYPIVLQAKGSQLQAVDLPEYNILASPDITLNFVKQNLKVQGTILIPYADITPQNFSSTVTLPSDVVFVHANKTSALPFTTSLQLTLELGDKIHLAYHDMTADPGGTLHITQLPGTPISAVGELYTKKGNYTAYGQTLKIQTGRLIYTGGSLMNPGLNISAVKKLKTVNTGGNVSNFSGTTSLQAVYTGTQSITVGVEVLGTLDNPVFNLYSSPAMAQADILSYLVFGFPQSQASGNQYGAILSALSSLNPNTAGASHFTKNLQEKWGLTEMSVESVQVFNPNATSSSNSVVSATSFVVGKKLSHNLSIHYSVGLFYPVSILNLRYKLAKHWAIQSETSTLDNGADVLYTIERD